MTRLYSSTVLGVDGVEVEVEVDFRPMAEKRTFIVGLPDAAVKESGQRVDTAIQNSGLPFQQGVFVVNLAPADLRKQGPGFDLPIGGTRGVAVVLREGGDGLVRVRGIDAPGAGADAGVQFRGQFRISPAPLFVGGVPGVESFFPSGLEVREGAADVFGDVIAFP